MKSILLFFQILLSVSLAYSQEYQLNFIAESESDHKIKIFDSYKDLVLGIDDSLVSLKIMGNLEAKVKSFVKIDTYSYEVEIINNQKIKYLEIRNKSDLSVTVNNVLDLYKSENGLIKFEKIDLFAREINERLSKNGFPFAKLTFTDYDLVNPSTLKSNLNIDYGEKRYLDKVIVKGYENFPGNFTKNIFKFKKNTPLDVDKALLQSKYIDKTKFARNFRDPEILFTKDSTSLYIYLEKIRRNSFDGFLSFDSDENSGKINVQGYTKITLNNTFNAGETINFDYKAQKNQDRSLNSNIILPYFMGSPLNLEYTLNLIQKDTTFNSNENMIEFDMNLDRIKVGLGFQNTKSNSNSLTMNVKKYKSNLFNVFSEYLIIDEEDGFMPELFKFSIRIGKGRKNQLGNETELTKYKIELSKKFNFSPKLKLNSMILKEEINSKNMVNNELLRFGGEKSIRGFDENSIFTNNYIVLKTNLNYYLSNTIYIYTIFDIAKYNNNILNIEKDIYSGGLGFSTFTENGIISVNYSKGNNWGNSFNLKNAKINISFMSFF